MTGKKIKIAYIHNDVARNAAYKKKKKSVVAWTSTVPARSLVSGYRTLPVTRMVRQESFLQQRIKEVTEELEKVQKENRKMELTQIMYQNLGRNKLQNVKEEDLDELGELIDEKLKDIDKRLNALAIQEN